MSPPPRPHGGKEELTKNLVSAAEAKELQAQNANAPRVVVSDADLSTVRRLGDGALSPLEGPMTREVFDRVLDEERLIVDGKSYAWGIPLALPITEDEKHAVERHDKAILVDGAGNEVALLEIADLFEWNKPRYNAAVYGTERTDHPGARIANDDPRGWLLGGRIRVFPHERHGNPLIAKYVYTPEETREKLLAHGWQASIAFQTRNPLHRAHEYAMVYAAEKLTRLGIRAGVVLNPLVGETKSDDVPAEIRMKSYINLVEHQLLGKGDSDPKVWETAGYGLNDVFDLFALDIKMFYGGPREAIMHAIYRQNYGFTHIIIGRKHADAPYDDGSNIWGDFDAQEKFQNLQGDLKIQPVNVGFAAYYEEIGRVGLIEEYAPKGWKPVTVSGRVLREQLKSGQMPDERIIRPETSKILIEAYREKEAAIAPSPGNNGDQPVMASNITWHHHSVTREMRERLNKHKGATLWFTGLSGSGKSTLANELAAALHERGVRTYVLDGDNIRHGLNKGLGFSAEDRKENIRRIGEVAKLFTDAGVINMTAFISPYRADRQVARDLQPESFLEVYVQADLGTCEERDPKGLYKKARAGEIKGFTGIDDPYEEPEAPEVIVDTAKNSVRSCVLQILQALEQRSLIPAFAAAETQMKE